MRREVLITSLVLAVVACGGDRKSETGPRGGTKATRTTNLRDLAVAVTTDKETYAAGEPIALTLRIRNPTGAPVLLRFATGQRYDFVIQSASGDERWRWAAGRMFTQALGEQTIPPAWEIDYNERFVDRLAAGRYRVRGYVTAVGDTLEATAEVVVRQ